MTELLTAAQMRAIESAAIESGEVTGLELMERAGRGVVEAVFEEWPDLAKAPHRAVVLCGPGNNGGDGFVVARLLKEWGWEVEVFLYGDPKKLPPDARVNYERWGELGSIKPLPNELDLLNADIFIDALFGAGLTRSLATELSETILDWHGVRRVAIDCPSGLCMDSGRPLLTSEYLEDEEPYYPRADLTITFHRPRVGHYIDWGGLSGKLVIKEIFDGVSQTITDSLFFQSGVRGARVDTSKVAWLVEFNEKWHRYQGMLPSPEWVRKASYRQRHKYSHGHALILSGGVGKTGAARLASRGALRIGAGLVTLGVPPSTQMEVASQVTAVMLRRVEGADGLAEVLEDGRLNAVCLGPGLGVERARELVPVVLGAARPGHSAGASAHEVPAQGRDMGARAVVLDADALTAFEDDPKALFAMLHENCVLTPHGGEFARLFPDIAEKLNATPSKGPAYSKVDATREAAKRAGCVVLFKGPDTVIAAPDGRCSINSAHYERAAPWLATAGAGDVLAGFIAGLQARGFGPMQAAETAAWLHVECARSFGPGLIAEDLPEELPKVFRDLGL